MSSVQEEMKPISVEGKTYVLSVYTEEFTDMEDEFLVHEGATVENIKSSLVLEFRSREEAKAFIEQEKVKPFSERRYESLILIDP